MTDDIMSWKTHYNHISLEISLLDTGLSPNSRFWSTIPRWRGGLVNGLFQVLFLHAAMNKVRRKFIFLILSARGKYRKYYIQYRFFIYSYAFSQRDRQRQLISTNYGPDAPLSLRPRSSIAVCMLVGSWCSKHYSLSKYNLPITYVPV